MSKPFDFVRQNKLAAELILERIEDFGGEESLPVQWARRVLGQQQGELFETAGSSRR